VYASVIGFQIIRWWDLQSGSERQVALERKTYLVSTILSFLLAFELFSLFLFIYNADHVHNLFVGAMCAVGSLNVNAFGYPALILKGVNFLLCGIWIILNYTDNRGYDYPLIKGKYKFLFFITALLLLEAIVQANYFMRMKANVITSCCGTMFSEDTLGVAGRISAVPAPFAQTVFYLSVAMVFRTGIHFYVTGRAARVFSYASNWMLFFSLMAIISFIAVYFYELPTHHCPFCLLQREYRFIGYPLYLSLFVAGILGAGTGCIDRYRTIDSLRSIVPSLQKRLCLASMIGYALFTGLATYPLVFSDFRLHGY